MKTKFQIGDKVQVIKKTGFVYYSGFIESMEQVTCIIICWIRLEDGSLCDLFEHHLELCPRA